MRKMVKLLVFFSIGNVRKMVKLQFFRIDIGNVRKMVKLQFFSVLDALGIGNTRQWLGGDGGSGVTLAT